MRGLRALISIAAMGLGAAPAAVRADVYRLAPGDTVEVGLGEVAGPAHRLVVQFDGTVSVPQLGAVEADGLTVAEFQQRLEVALSTRPMRVKGPDGREQLVMFQPGDVTAAVVDYRPIYVSGTVRAPGQQPFRPQITVRQAMAVAGGFSTGPTAGDPAAGRVDAWGERQALWLDLARERVRGARIEAELAGKSDFEVALTGMPLDTALADAFVQSEREALAIASADRARLKAHTDATLKDLDAMIEVLARREQDEAEAVKADEDELARVKQVFDQGFNTNARLGDVRRALLMSSSRLLDTTVELMKLRQQKAEESRRAEQAASEWRVGLLRDQSESKARVAELAARIGAGSAEQAGTPSVGTPLVPAITVTRRINGAWQQVEAGQDFELLPGDVVEISVGEAAPVAAPAAGPVAAPAASAPPTRLHYAPNNNFDASGRFAPLTAGFNLADVSTPEQLARLPDGVRALVWVGMCDGVSTAFRDRVEPFLGDPRVFGYYLVDEPDPTGRWHPACPPANVRLQSDWLHERHPDARTFLMLMSYGPSDAASYDAAYAPEHTNVDLFGVNPYPCRSELDGCDFAMIDRAVDEAVAAGYPRAGLVPTFQAFGGGDWETNGGGHYLLPTLEQFTTILDRWAQVLPDPVFDYAYSWGVQEDDVALETAPHLQALMLKHNLGERGAWDRDS